MNKLVVVIMGQDCEKTIGMALESVKDADSIVFCDGGSTDKTKELCLDIALIENKYDQEDKGMNGKQRNFYLDYLKKNYKDYWALCIDADEVVTELDKIKAFIEEAQDNIYSLPMRHFIGDLGHEDATEPVHFALGRLFKVDDKLSYPEVEHPVIQGKEHIRIHIGTLWHLAYIPNLKSFKKKYENHLKKSNMHTPEFLKQWYMAHLFGQYPKSNINLIEIPPVILKEFGIDPDEIYFGTHKTLEARHFIMVKQWLDRFKPKTVLDLGCGLGLYGQALNILDESIGYYGIELSDWAVKNCQFNLGIAQGDVTKEILIDKRSDLVLVLDILEHLDEKDLNKALKNISKCGKNFIFSIPYLGDPNLNADPTHKIKKSKEWWIKQLSKYFNVSDVPDWLFKHQLLIGETK